MTKSLLLVTNDAALSNLMQQGIQKAGYHLHIAKHKGEAVILTDTENCSLAFLDLDIGEHLVTEIGRSIRTVKPTINLILFSDDDTSPVLDEIRPWILLRKPFHIPDLLTMLNDNPFEPTPSRASDESSAVPLTDNENNELVWLQDVTKAAQHLTRLTLEIICTGGVDHTQK